ncbi:MAG: MmgE/PrpD family protein, partial [Deltaproteobacteria bacterium]|nr:MmgE/PrpD family protein [Deltaproteobacteria bacterium]
RALQRKVKLVEDAVATRKFYEEQKSTSTVEITTRRGEVFRRHVEYPKGEPENPLRPEELRGKLANMAREAGLSGAQTEQLLVRLGALERLESIRDLSPFLVPRG